uniref:Small ribosomal subunit protein bS6c n=1 Tax=Melanthalia intermedia TaxID=172989 RepID=A0A345UAF5_9FLOR|nr:ribosomal protein S6 [Melanthalia intermedia]AXI97441.1 ribosomal protein S6 [Melanthalia intermedia]
MKFNNYETIYILKPSTQEKNNLVIANKYKSLIKKYGGQNIFIQYRDRRHLSYEIKSYYDGIYVQINYTVSSNSIKIIEKAIRSNDDILRCLTIKCKK